MVGSDNYGNRYFDLGQREGYSEKYNYENENRKYLENYENKSKKYLLDPRDKAIGSHSHGVDIGGGGGGPGLGFGGIGSGIVMAPAEHSRRTSSNISFENQGNRNLTLAVWDGLTKWETVVLKSGAVTRFSCLQCGATSAVSFHNGKEPKMYNVDVGGSYLVAWDQGSQIWQFLASCGGMGTGLASCLSATIQELRQPPPSNPFDTTGTTAPNF